MQLVAADVDRVNALRSARKQHLRKAAGRGADIETDAAGDIERKMIECGGELDSAARDIGVLGPCGNDGRRRNFFGRLTDDRAVGDHAAGSDCRLRAGAAFEQAARHQKTIDTVSAGHGRSIIGGGDARVLAQRTTGGQIPPRQISKKSLCSKRLRL